MKRFIKDLVFFSTAVFLTFIFIFSLVWVLLYNKINGITLDKNINTIICGDSHPQSAVNDTNVKYSLNVSMASQHLIYTYSLIKLLHNRFPSVKNLVIGVSFHSFNEYDSVIFDLINRNNQFISFFPILDLQSIQLITSKNPIYFSEKLIEIFKTMLLTILCNDNTFNCFEFMGGYYPSRNSNLNKYTIEAAIKRHYYNSEGVEQGHSKYQEKYLFLISKFCKDKNIKLIIINTPIHPLYLKNIPKKFKQKYYSTMLKLKRDATFYDFHSINLNDSCYGDADHLNFYGANFFSTKLDSLLQKKN